MSAALPAIRVVFPSGTGVFPVAGVKNGLGGGGDTGFQRRHSGSGLQGRAGGIGGRGSPVLKGLGRIGGQFSEILPICGEIICGIGSQRQNLPGAHLDHSGGGTPAVQMVFLV